MSSETDLHVNLNQLRARGWTKTLIERYLGDPDRWESVDHWANFRGRATYLAQRVMLVESQADFKYDFGASAHRRRLSREGLDQILAYRAQWNDKYSSLMKSAAAQKDPALEPLRKAAALFNDARSRGYRTPHK